MELDKMRKVTIIFIYIYNYLFYYIIIFKLDSIIVGITNIIINTTQNRNKKKFQIKINRGIRGYNI